MAKKTRKTGKRGVVTGKSTQQRGAAKKKSGGGRKPLAARRQERSNTPGSGPLCQDRAAVFGKAALHAETHAITF